MNSLPAALQITTIILIALGIGVMAFAISNIRNIFKFKLDAKYSRYWRGLYFLVFFFLLGYLASLVLIAIGLSSLLIIASGIIFFLGGIFVYLVSSLSFSTIKMQQQITEALKSTAAELRAATEDLQTQRNTLELQVVSRTRDLQHRIKQLNTISEVTRAIAQVQNINELLPLITQLINSNFGFYHVAIFLIDENRKYAVLRAANSLAGQRMLARGHRLEVGQVGIVGFVSQRGEPRIASDVNEEADFLNNPDLPNTHSEMALPLMAGEEVIGVLDVQSEQPSAFGERDVEIMRTMADQIAIAIENARSFSETNKALNEAQAIYRQFLHQEWGRMVTEEEILGYRYSQAGVEPLVKKDLKTKTKELHPVEGEADGGKDFNGLSVPVKLRDETIGFLTVRSGDPNRQWTDNEKILIQAVTDRVALSMENARLIEETTQRADRERTVTEITTKIRSSTDPQTMLRTAIDELKKVLGTDEIQIRPLVSLPVGKSSTGSVK